ncbi:hypothetical protein [Alteriqipengyuania sp.]|uniref:hypothetical protein n=1 Tax=Alteriqipengyuania sp. TaxID=2800692 RepID=UPI003516BDD8
MIDLKTRLSLCAEAWATAHTDDGGERAPLSRLSKRVMDDGKFFDNLGAMRRGPSTDTLEKFARYLIDPANWPEGRVASEAVELAHVVGVTLPASDVSAGLSGDLSGASASPSEVAPECAGHDAQERAA